MKLEDIKGDAVILADNYLHTSIRFALLQTHSALSNVSVLSFENYLQNQMEQKEDTSFYEYARIISALDLDAFKEVAQSCDFIEEVMQFIVQLKKHQITIESLPESDNYQKELKYIIGKLMEVSLQIDDQSKTFQLIDSFEGVYIVDYNADVYKEKIYEGMEKKGAIRIEKDKLDPTKEFFYVLNKREEVESLARYIIERNINLDESKLTLLDDEYAGFVKQIFERYQIPFHFIQKKEANRLVYKYIALIHYYNNPNNESLLKLIEEEVFTHKYMGSFKEYIEVFDKTLKDDFMQIRNAEISFDIMDKREMEKLCKLEEKAKEVKEYIIDDLTTLLSLNLKDALMFVDEVVVEHHYFHHIDDMKSVRSIRNTIKLAMPYISADTIDILVYQLGIIQVSQKQTIRGIAVTSLRSMVGNSENHFILGASSDNYPKFENLSGIFSEDYVSQFQYPSLDARYQLYEKNLNNNLCSSKKLIVFYATSSLNGKEKEAALEIENFMQMRPVYYSLTHGFKQYDINTQLKKETSEALFLRQGVLNGSVSSMEKYSNCPFKYFVSNGLRISEPVDYTFSSAKSGKLMHYVLEVLAQKYGKLYPDTAQEEISKLLDEKMRELIKIYPSMEANLIVIKTKIVESIEKNFQFMKSYEQHSNLRPSKYEEEFNYEMKYDALTLRLNGFIDRINENNDFISVMDYKSSKHVLKEEEVFSCLKLQLLTYVLVCAKKYDKRVVGAHYYSFLNKKQLGQYAKYTKKDNEVTAFEEYNYQDAFMKEKRLEGWLFQKDVEVIDDDLTHINGIGFKADGSYTARTNIYDLNKVEVVLYQMYQQLVSGIVGGDMSITPVSCAFCKYGSICHYKGKAYKREILVDCSDIYIVHKGKEESSDGNLE